VTSPGCLPAQICIDLGKRALWRTDSAQLTFSPPRSPVSSGSPDCPPVRSAVYATVCERPISLSGQCSVQPSAESGAIDGSRLPRKLLAVAKQDQRRNAADVETAGQLRLLIGIDFADL
jgi:hypothetical protein